MTKEQQLEWVNISRSLPVNLPEFPLLLEHYDLPEPNLLSPLPELCRSEGEADPRSIQEIIEPTSGAADEAVALALTPLVSPDRIIDLRLALFNSAPELTRLYASRLVGNQMVALATHNEFDYELIFPFSYDDLMVWLRMQLQFSSGMTFPLHRTEFSAHELAFLCALADAYKAVYVRSFLPRRNAPIEIIITIDDILEAQEDARKIHDRRWLLHALNELFAEIIHVGGGSGVRLPALTEEFVEAEISRYVEKGFLVQVEGAKAGCTLDEPLESFLGDFFNWISLINIHDLQVVGGGNNKAEAQEEALIFITTGSTVWTLATEGLTDCSEDLSGVRFGMRSLEMVSALDVAADFIEPVSDVEIAQDFYGSAPMGRFEESLMGDAAGKQVESVTCPACGASVRVGVKFCTQCGQALGESGS
jgi:hypothetical protein